MSAESPTFVRCPGCGATNPQGGMFCEQCHGHLGAGSTTGATAAARCPHCEACKPPGSETCAGCGLPVEPSNLCPICRAIVPTRSTACPSCRTSFGEIFYGMAHCWRCGGEIGDAPAFARPSRYAPTLVIAGVALTLSLLMPGAPYLFLVLLPVGIWGYVSWLAGRGRPPLLSCRSCGDVQRRLTRRSDPFRDSGFVILLLYLLAVILIFTGVMY